MNTLKTKYDHRYIESKYYDTWVSKGYFEANDKSKKPYCIVIPPPNVTGKLHLGHAWDCTLQDIIARYKRLCGYDMLWVAGMDHAGIATQAKVDERLMESGISRHDIGREEFLKHAWKWKEEYGECIHQQWAKMGFSLDYSRERFTLDEGLSEAVEKVFTDLYNQGYIYQGERIINWDPKLKTALSNVEVDHIEIEGAMYYFKYMLENGTDFLTVATTRPETMFGDVCVVVNPKDERYQHLVGKKVMNPANGEWLPIISDSYIDIEFGTGAMKCTPAHDPNDFALGEKYNLDKIVCMKEDATMNEKANEFEGLDRFECRKQLVAKLEKEGLFLKKEVHRHPVAHSQRSGVIVEPYLSKQWFVKVQEIAKEVLEVQNSDQKIKFYPQRFEKTLQRWLENIEDWCISRQLWWGHRIPVYYHLEDESKIVVGKAPLDIENYRQDEDVLDTWFSSGLWPFSALGWPEESEDFKRFYPNNVLVTGYDIIFFWVARMALQARFATKSIPFNSVLIHGLVRDNQGRKMSKSLGNGIDPMDIIEQHGVDALRFFLTTNSTPGQDLRYFDEKVEASKNFINKIYNATLFVQRYIHKMELKDDFDFTKVSGIDYWILNKLNKLISKVKDQMDNFEFSLVGNELYRFIWDDFCNWYIEFSKASLNSEDDEVFTNTIHTIHHVLKSILIMIHPFMPFVSEELYLSLPNSKESIHLETYPLEIDLNDNQELDVELLISIITTIREIRSDYQVKPSKPLTISVYDADNKAVEFSRMFLDILEKMAKVSISSTISGELVERISGSVVIKLALDSVVDIEEEKLKLQQELQQIHQEIKRCEKMLSNPKFMEKAPQMKIEEEKNKLEKYQLQKELIEDKISKYFQK